MTFIDYIILIAIVLVLIVSILLTTKNKGKCSCCNKDCVYKKTGKSNGK